MTLISSHSGPTTKYIGHFKMGKCKLELLVINSDSSLNNLTSSCWSLRLTSLRAIFPSAERAAKENRREERPGVSWAGVQGLIMESVSHKQNSVNSDSGSNASKEFGGNWEISCFCLLYFLVIYPSIWSYRLFPLSWTGNVNVWSLWEKLWAGTNTGFCWF